MTESIQIAHVRSLDSQLEFAGSKLREEAHMFLITGQQPNDPIFDVRFSAAAARDRIPEIMGTYPTRLVVVHPRVCEHAGPDVPPSPGLEPARRRELLSLTKLGRDTLADERNGHR